jgi:hypothetical protein
LKPAGSTGITGQIPIYTNTTSTWFFWDWLWYFEVLPREDFLLTFYGKAYNEKYLLSVFCAADFFIVG